LAAAAVERLGVRGVIGVVSAFARAFVLDGALRVPERIGALEAILDAARGNQCKGGEA
jgi:hypothetical protein